MTEDALIEQCYALDWTDGLPVVPPTQERVAAMVDGRDPSEVIAILEPGRGVATVEKIAANAVMAGCLPEYFPVVLAAVSAAGDPAFRLEGVLTTIHSQSPLVIVSGPVVEKLAFNAGSNVLGSGNRANATVGRALMLVMRNIAGARPGRLDPATLGHPGKYSYLIAENETASPWPPIRVDQGFAEDQSTVTVLAADAPLCLANLGATGPESILHTIADALPIAGTYNMAFSGPVVIVMSPEHARICADAGLSRDDVREYLFRYGRKPASQLRGLGAISFGEVTPGWIRDYHPNEAVAPVRDPKQFTVVVAGGDVGGYTAVIFCSGRAVTKEVPRV